MIVALVLLGIVSVGVWQFANYMYDSYKRSETLWIEEQAVHKVAQSIYDLTDTAFQAEILNAVPALQRNMIYIFGNASDTSSPQITATDLNGDYWVIDGVELNGLYFEPKERYPMDLVFRPAVDTGGNTLPQAVTFTLTGRIANYVLDTTVYFPNMNDNQQTINSAGPGGGRVLAFQIWGDTVSANLRPIIIEMTQIGCCGRRN
jgi:hypothetical protein